MRHVQWLFVVSVALFISGIAFVVAAGRTMRTAAPPAPVVSTTPVATIKQLMNGIVTPASTVIYGSVGTVISVRGIEETAPANDEEWAVVGNNAAALVEAGNLLLMEGRALDTGDWVTMTRAYMDAANEAVAATTAKSTEGILAAGSDLNETCDNCHAKYQRQ